MALCISIKKEFILESMWLNSTFIFLRFQKPLSALIIKRSGSKRKETKLNEQTPPNLVKLTPTSTFRDHPYAPCNVSISLNVWRKAEQVCRLIGHKSATCVLSLRAEALHMYSCFLIGFLFCGKAWMKVSGGLFCCQWLMSVAHCFPSWKKKKIRLTNLCLKILWTRNV